MTDAREWLYDLWVGLEGAEAGHFEHVDSEAFDDACLALENECEKSCQILGHKWVETNESYPNLESVACADCGLSYLHQFEE